jgi:pyridoxine 5-phosphate synthase
MVLDIPSDHFLEKLFASVPQIIVILRLETLTHSMKLLVNIDHIATLRNARGEGYPDPVEAAYACENAGASGIVFHLRGDRRHIRDEDVTRLKAHVRGTLDFEMAATDEMIGICTEIQPDICTLVPEGRLELTTEGGLALTALEEDFRERVLPKLTDAGVPVSLFLDPVPVDIETAARLGVYAIELHTGPFSNAQDETIRKEELARLRTAAELIHSAGMKVNAGHGLNLQNLPRLIAEVPHLHEISIGHALISRAVFDGLEKTVRAYLAILNHGTGNHG